MNRLEGLRLELRAALCAVLAAAFLTACAGSSASANRPGSPSGSSGGSSQSQSAGQAASSDASSGSGSAPASSESGSASASSEPGSSSDSSASSSSASSALMPEQRAAAYRQEILQLVNAEREQAGLAPLVLDATLNTAAQLRAEERAKTYSYTRPDGTNFYTVLEKSIARNVSEVPARGQTLQTPEQVVCHWMKSDEEQALLLAPGRKKLGVGYVEAQDAHQYYWTLLLTN